jgi:hypothetical protein
MIGRLIHASSAACVALCDIAQHSFKSWTAILKGGCSYFQSSWWRLSASCISFVLVPVPGEIFLDEPQDGFQERFARVT